MAEAHLSKGDPDGAEAELTQAIDLARRGGDGPTLAEAAVVGDRIGQARSGGSIGRGTRKADASRVGSTLVESLTPRELEVLRLVCAGRSNSQIATELFVTVGTAKAHIHTIYGKLGAANRVEAILRARDLGLSS
jgi:LuxR family maltose regulon positive regulatory protein